jgi:predicted metal-dependent phosphoesterase TrpH
MPIDLHTHSNASDGTFPPAELAAMAKQRGLTHVALTDHNTVSGLPAFMAEAERLGITAVAGTELSTVLDGREIHLLGLFIPPERYADITELTSEYRGYKEQSNMDLAARLTANGYTVDYEDLRRRNPDRVINRALIAEELLAGGHVPSVKAAFDTILGEGMGYYIPPERLDFFTAIRFLRSIGALPVWAHPLQYIEESIVRAALPEAVEAGLLGMEVMHSSYDEATVTRAKAIADEFGLLYSGGSDFHGTAKPTVRLGIGCQEGEIPNIPDDFYTLLSERAKGL